MIEISLPTLLRRREDILLLGKAFLNHFSTQNHKKITGFSSHAIEYLLSYNWPGNIRELRNAIERAVILSRTAIVQLVDLLPPSGFQSQQALEANQSLHHMEKQPINGFQSFGTLIAINMPNQPEVYFES